MRKFWFVAMTLLACCGLFAKDVLVIEGIQKPRVQVTEKYILVAGRTTLEVFDTIDDQDVTRLPIGRFDMETVPWGQMGEMPPANAVISGFAALPSYQAIFVNVFGMSYSGTTKSRFFRSLLLDDRGNFLGFVLDHNLDDYARVYYRNVFDVGDGELIVNDWQEKQDFVGKSVESIQLKSIRLVARGSDFVVESKVRLPPKFFDKTSNTSNNKNVWVERRPDGLLAVVYPFEPKVHYFNGSHGKVGFNNLKFDDFSVRDFDGAVDESSSQILDVHHAADGVWLAYKSNLNSPDERQLKKVTDEHSVPFKWPEGAAKNRANYSFACFGGNNVYFWEAVDQGFRLVSFDLD